MDIHLHHYDNRLNLLTLCKIYFKGVLRLAFICLLIIIASLHTGMWLASHLYHERLKLEVLWNEVPCRKETRSRNYHLMKLGWEFLSFLTAGCYPTRLFFLYINVSSHSAQLGRIDWLSGQLPRRLLEVGLTWPRRGSETGKKERRARESSTLPGVQWATWKWLRTDQQHEAVSEKERNRSAL